MLIPFDRIPPEPGLISPDLTTVSRPITSYCILSHPKRSHPTWKDRPLRSDHLCESKVVPVEFRVLTMPLSIKEVHVCIFDSFDLNVRGGVRRGGRGYRSINHISISSKCQYLTFQGPKQQFVYIGTLFWVVVAQHVQLATVRTPMVSFLASKSWCPLHIFSTKEEQWSAGRCRRRYRYTK